VQFLSDHPAQRALQFVRGIADMSAQRLVNQRLVIAAAGRLGAEPLQNIGALNELASRMRILSGAVDLSVVEQPLCVALSDRVAA